MPSSAAQVHGADCRNLVVNRTYAGNFAGYLNIPVYYNVDDDGSVGVLPNAGTGKITFLPGGKVNNVETIVIGIVGLFKDKLITGTYDLAWDTKQNPLVCVGAIHASDGSEPYDFQLIVPRGADRIEMIHTNPGLIVGTSMFPMRSGTCRNASINGTYTYNTTGWALAMPDTPADQRLSAYVPGAMSGAMHFYPRISPDLEAFSDAPLEAGSVSAWDIVSMNGSVLPVPRTMKGWFTVDHNCALTIVLVDNIGNPPFHIQGFIGRGSHTIYAANIDTLEPEGKGAPVFLMPITLSRSDNEENED